jgi:hypothetical protein
MPEFTIIKKIIDTIKNVKLSTMIEITKIIGMNDNKNLFVPKNSVSELIK